MVRVQITLTGDKADRFREIHEQLEEELGYSPSRTEVVGYLMGQVGEYDEIFS